MAEARRKPLGRILVVLGATAIALAAAARRPAEAYYSSTWYEDADGYAHAVRQQRAQHVPILVYFRVDWCPHCRTLDDLLDDYEVRSRLNQVIKVRVNPEHGAAEKDLFSSRFGSSGYPTLFLQSEGGAASRLSTRGPAKEFVTQLPE